MTTMPEINATATLRLKEKRGELAIFAVPGTDYELHLVSDGSFESELGKRVRGEVHATALRMHPAEAGGRFIEPIYGPPRIVQGSVLAVDAANRRVLMDLSIPAWVGFHADNDPAQFQPGDLWNCYIESGTRFVPVD